MHHFQPIDGHGGSLLLSLEHTGQYDLALFAAPRCVFAIFRLAGPPPEADAPYQVEIRNACDKAPAKEMKGSEWLT